MLSPGEFDATFYMETNPDIRTLAEMGGLVDPYDHYRLHGFAEGRMGRADDTYGAHNEAVWANLINTLSELRTSTAVKATQLDTVKSRRTARIALRRSSLS